MRRGSLGMKLLVQFSSEGGSKVWEEYQWLTTSPNPRSSAMGVNAGQRGWRLHAVKASPEDNCSAVRGAALCGIRPRYGWGFDLFVDDKCVRCANKFKIMKECEMSDFKAYVDSIQALAERDGATDPGVPYCDAETWRDAFRDGLAPADAWQGEREAAADMLG